MKKLKMKKLKQIGFNPKYPESPETWKFGEMIPEWLSDRARILFLDGSGQITLDTRDVRGGGLEILGVSGDVLVEMKTRADILVWDSGWDKPESLTPRQFELIYEEA